MINSDGRAESGAAAPPDIRLPRLPAPMERPRIPVIAAVVPVVFAGVVFLVTGSTLALLFAFLGPLIALGATADAILLQRRRLSKAAGILDREIASARERIHAAHSFERVERFGTAIDVHALLGGDTTLLWRPSAPTGALPTGALVCVGTAVLPSRFAVAHPDGIDDEHPLSELYGDCATLHRAPIVIDACSGIAVVGPGARAAAVARAVVVSVSAQWAPDESTFDIDSAHPAWDFVPHLPHAVRAGTTAVTTDRRSFTSLFVARQCTPATAASPRRAVVAAVTELAAVPRECTTVIEITTTGAMLRHGPAAATPFDPIVMSREEAAAFAELARERAEQWGIQAAGRRNQATTTLTELIAATEPRDESPALGLGCAFTSDATGGVFIDLVSDGPHAVVAGVTGSGKSELLTSWILAMCSARPPGGLDLLLVDFKGGAQFDALAELPHVVGVVTDLDGASATRILASLRSELERRERTLRARGAKSIDGDGDGDGEAPGAADRLSRLVIVVDEYAVVAERHPQLVGLFSDIAARGRSLGVHLILCTQRVAGVVKDALLANLPLRLCLRVTSAAESSTVIGSPVAAALATGDQGTVYIQRSGEEPQKSRLARSTGHDVASAAVRWGRRPQHQPWLQPLPDSLRLADLPGSRDPDELVFALGDEPDAQRQRPVGVRPNATDGFAIIGPPRSGRSQMLHTLQQSWTGPARRLPTDAASLWDAVGALADLVDSGQAGGGNPPCATTVVLIDDLDVAVSHLPEEYQSLFLERVEKLIRRGRSAGILAAVALSDSARGLLRVTDACTERLELGRGDTDVPGRGRFRGIEVQIATVDRSSDAVTDPVDAGVAQRRWMPTGSTIIISTRPAQVAERLRGKLDIGLSVALLTAQSRGWGGQPGDAVVAIGDPDAWQTNWAALAALRVSTEIIFDGCTIGDVRALARTSTLPPPWARHERPIWLLGTDGEFCRIRLAIDDPAA